MACHIKDLIAKIKTLSGVDQRRVAALLGATVADVATRPLHWMYKQNELDAAIGTTAEIEFWPDSKCPFFTIPLGEPCFYNDIALVTLSSLSENNGNLNLDHLLGSMNTYFGAGSKYADTLKARQAENAKLPVDGPWIHKSMIRFLENYKDGENNPGDIENKEFDGFCAALPLISKHAGRNIVWEEALKVISVITTEPKTTEMFHTACLLLNSFIMGEQDAVDKMKDSIESLYPDVYQIIGEVEDAVSRPFQTSLDAFGKCCYLPGTFQCAMLVLLKTSSFIDAVRLNITGGGCSGGRANFIGACYGAKYGIDGIPIEWLKKVNNIEKIIEMTLKIVGNA